MIVVSTGCPAGIGPEISVLASRKVRGVPVVLVGDTETLMQAAELVGVPRERLRPMSAFESPERSRGLYVHQAGPTLTKSARRPGKPNAVAGVAQLLYVEEAVALCRRYRVPLVTAAVSKAAIAGSGEARAASFRGHTEWLQALDGVSSVTMCFWTPKFSTSLVTTHLPLADVPRAIDERGVKQSTLHLVELLSRLGISSPRVAVSSLNPHAGEGGLLGAEEETAIVPGIRRARREGGTRATITGPIGAETAYRKASLGDFDGVVAMYHDQATIPTKLLSFGSAVNVTMGLSFTRTSVDHGTGYDIAWQGVAKPEGMSAAIRVAQRLG